MKPLLASLCTKPEALPFPVIASPKFDGIRCLIIEGPDGDALPVSRNLKPIRNDHIRAKLSHRSLIGMDGELMTYTADTMDSFEIISGNVMRKEGTPNFFFQVFDYHACPSLEFWHRADIAEELINEELPSALRVRSVEQKEIRTLEDLDAYESEMLALGFEGIMVRRVDGKYKFGRSTEREAILLKVKRFAQDEAWVVGTYELEANTNEQTRDALGHSKRSSHKAGKVGKGVLGGFVLKPLATGQPSAADFKWVEDNAHRLDAAVAAHPTFFKCGSGFDALRRELLWKEKNRKGSLGKVVTYKHQLCGAKEGGKPRFPIFKGFRHADDL